MRTRRTPRLILLICTLLLAGCGQTGPLYLPEPEHEQSQEPRETEARPVPGS
ncbi:MAG: lipoprotein [Gammaproteobacteria bacterium]|nr:lipoprotein [Gammaproteobacteria bacterium]